MNGTSFFFDLCTVRGVSFDGFLTLLDDAPRVLSLGASGIMLRQWMDWRDGFMLASRIP